MSNNETIVLALLFVLLEWQRQAAGKSAIAMWVWVTVIWVALNAAQFINRMGMVYLMGFAGGAQ